MDYQGIRTNHAKLLEFSRRLFIKVDKNHNNQISMDELKSLMVMIAKEIGSAAPTDDEIKIIIKRMDKNSDSLISEDEFVDIASMLLDLLIKK